MPQRELAHHLRVSVQAVSKWENDRAFPDLVLLPDIANMFGVTLDELFGQKAGGQDVS
jgi:transcriptional regulator with XRE-family HTH domain